MELNKNQKFAKAAVNLAAAKQIHKGKISLDELAKLAECLSNYGGSELVDYSGIAPETYAFLSAYTGAGDDLVDMDGGDFQNETQQAMIERVFTITITNGETTDQVFYLTPGFEGTNYLEISGGGLVGYYQTVAAGVLVREGVNASTAGTPLTVACSPKPFQWFSQFVQKNPTRVVGFKLTSTVATQLQTPVIFERQSPFKDLQNLTLQLSNYQNEHTYQDKTVTVPMAFQLDDQMRVRFTIKASSTMTITLFCGAVANVGKLLEKRAVRARNTVPQMPKSYNSLGLKDEVILGGVRRPLMIGG